MSVSLLTDIPRGAGAGLSVRCAGVCLLPLDWGSFGERLEGEAAVEEAPEDKVLPVGEDMKAQAYAQHP